MHVGCAMGFQPFHADLRSFHVERYFHQAVKIVFNTRDFATVGIYDKRLDNGIRYANGTEILAGVEFRSEYTHFEIVRDGESLKIRIKAQTQGADGLRSIK